MGIKRIAAKNFKSFRDFEVHLGKINVLIGPNASGKSNFTQLFQFLRDIVISGLENAISLQGGAEYLVNINIGTEEDFSLSVIFDTEYGFALKTESKDIVGVEIFETLYEFTLKLLLKESRFRIVKENLRQKCNFIRLEEDDDELKEKEKLGEGEMLVSRSDGTIDVKLIRPDNVFLEDDDLFPPFMLKEERYAQHLIIEMPYLPIYSLYRLLRDIVLFDFDPKLSKKATPITGQAELVANAGNLSIVLKNIISNREKKRKFNNLIRELLPFIDDLSVQKLTDKSLIFQMREIYAADRYLPAFMLSDGTININALLIALYFEDKLLTIIEEPDRNLHPYLISKVVNMIKDASNKRQIVITTHNPEIIKHIELNDILLVTRDEDGYSRISRIAEKEEIKIFLKNEMGVEELFIQNLLDI